jgi:hypothetical protein
LEVERLEAERRERLEGLAKERERFQAEQLRHEEREPLDRTQEDVGQTLGTPSGAAESGLPHFVRKWRYIPFVLVLLSYLLPFFYQIENGKIVATSGYSFVLQTIGMMWNYRVFSYLEFYGRLPVILAMLRPVFVLSSSFFKYKRKEVLEVILSWTCFGMIVLQVIIITSYGFGNELTFGIILACIFAATGAAVQTYLFKHRQ